MKVEVTFKPPDVMDQLRDLSEDEREEVEEVIEKFVEYSEYVQIEFDTETKTAMVIEL